jgi:hypothetical protein
MSETGKTVLIAGGVVVGAYVLMKFMAPTSRLSTASKPASTLGSVISGIAAIGPSLSNLFGRSPSGGTGSNLSAGDREIFDTVTDKSGAVDLTGVYDNSGIVDTLGGNP